MQIIEQSSIGKRNQETCEDGIVVTDNFVAVIDGSTSKGHCQFQPNMRNGQYSMTLIRQYIASMPADVTAQKFCQLITAYLRFIYSRYDANLQALEAHPEERLTASAAVYSRHHREIWLIGDCQCIVDGKPYDNPKPYEQPIADIRSGYVRLALLDGASVDDFRHHDKGRDHILPLLVESCRNQNKTYAVIDGFDIPMDHIKVIPADTAGEIILASDGYPYLKGTLAESEQALSQLLAEDPLCVNTFRATKGMMEGFQSFDDRTYVRFRDNR